MSKVSYINNSYGEEITFAIANTYGGKILKSKQLPPNTFIISSPLNKYNIDSNSPSIFYTDADGSPVRLTYNLVLGNGFVKEAGTDIVHLNIDNTTLKTNTSGSIGVNTNNVFSNELHISGLIGVNTSKINIASETENGVVKIDNDTILIDESIHYINTVNLNRATNEMYGIATSDNDTISINNGIISVNTERLDKTHSGICGIIKPDNQTIISNDGELHVEVNNLPSCGNISGALGIAKPDNENLSVDNGVLYVSRLPISSSGSLGVVRVNNDSFALNNNVLEVKNYIDLNDRLTAIKNKIIEFNEIVKNGIIGSSFVSSFENPTIFTFMCNSVSTKTLTKPVYGLFPDTMDYEKINVTCIINTNCPFFINVDFENNLTPPAFLVSVSYKNVTYEGENCKNIEFAPTYEKDEQINFEFYFKNVAIANGKQTYITKIHLAAHYSLDDDIYQDILYSIVRYNSMFKPTASETILTTSLLGAEKISISNVHVINNEPKPYSGGSKISFTQHRIKK